MNPQQAREIWAQKIASPEDFTAAEQATRGWTPFDPSAQLGSFTIPSDSAGDVGLMSETTWWINREARREQYGIYPPPTQVLIMLRQLYGSLGQFFPHVSKGDIDQIAYTPDQQNGMADRQVRIAVGKFFRKFLLTISDKEVARLEAAHKAELDPNFLIATSLTDIERVYTKMDGDSGCMRYPKGRFNHTKYHPSAVYSDMPGLGVAYIETAEKIIKARAVVYTDPNNPKDKRFVRLYGAPALQSKLLRAGYRMAGLEGVKLRKLHDPGTDETCIVMPYLDNPGGNGGVSTDAAPYIIAPQGEDYIVAISTATAQKYEKAKIPVTYAQGTGGSVSIREADLSTLKFTCPLSGAPVDRLTDKVTWYLRSPNEIPIEVKITPVMAPFRRLHFTTTNGNQELLCLAPEVDASLVQVPGFHDYYNDAATRKTLGIALLDPEWYANEGYVRNQGVVFDPTGRVMKIRDAIRVFPLEWDHDGIDTFHHNSNRDTLREAGYLPVPDVNGLKLLCHKDNKHLIHTNGGRRAVLGIHDVKENLFGGWDRDARINAVRVLGNTVWISRDLTLTDAQIGVISSSFLNAFPEIPTLKSHRLSVVVEHLRSLMNRGAGNLGAPYMTPSGQIAHGTRYETPSLSSMLKAATKITEENNNAAFLISTFGQHNAIDAVLWTKASTKYIAAAMAECPGLNEALYSGETE